MNTDYEKSPSMQEPEEAVERSEAAERYAVVPVQPVTAPTEPEAPDVSAVPSEASEPARPEADSRFGGEESRELSPEPSPALRAESARKKAPRFGPERKQADQKQPEPEQPGIDNPAQEQGTSVTERMIVCDVQFHSGGKLYFFDPGALNLKNGDHIILDTVRGAEYGYCVIGNHKIARRELEQPLRRVLRLATPTDERVKAENERKEKDAYAFCLKKVEELGLDMQLVSTELAFDGSKLLFFFTADARVDFRELVRILAANFHTRIELRQIGVRDKAKMLGGLGICGRPFCCASFLEDFQPVSIKMAKTQNLSLNPAKISGTCGRLMCCLKYEQEAYEDLIKTSPKQDSFVDTPEGRGTVTSVNLMRQSVTVRMEKDETELHSYRNSEICILRNGKAKKNDPPIPEDLAPISGRREESVVRERFARLDQRLTVEAEEFETVTEPLREPRDRSDHESSHRERNADSGSSRRARRERKPERDSQKEAHESAKEKSERKAGQNSRRKNNRSGEKAGEYIEAALKTERGEKLQPSRQQRRRQQQGKQELKLPHAEPQPRRPAPEKRQEEQSGARPDAAKKNNHRRYYHNRKPKGE